MSFFNYSRLGYVFFKDSYEGDKLPYWMNSKNRLTWKMFGQWCFTLICPVKWDAGMAFIREFNYIILFLFVFPYLNKRKGFPEKWVVWMDNSYCLKMWVTMRSIKRLRKSSDMLIINIMFLFGLRSFGMDGIGIGSWMPLLRKGFPVSVAVAVRFIWRKPLWRQA